MNATKEDPLVHLFSATGAEKQDIVVETDAGALDCRWRRNDNGDFRVRVNMGQPKLSPPPFIQESSLSETPVRVHPVNMGNPHGVIFMEATKDRVWMQDLAVNVGEARAFPEGVNVGFALITDQSMDLTVHERGCGFTEACGTGACAAVAAALTEGYLSWGSKVEVRLPGGSLFIDWERGKPIYMEGPSERISTGETFLECS